MFRTLRTLTLPSALGALLLSSVTVLAFDPPPPVPGLGATPVPTPLGENLTLEPTPIFKTITETITISGAAPNDRPVITENISVGVVAPPSPGVMLERIEVSGNDHSNAATAALRDSRDTTGRLGEVPRSERGTQESGDTRAARDPFARSTGVAAQESQSRTVGDVLGSPWMIAVYVVITALVFAAGGAFIGRGRLRRSIRRRDQ